MTLAPSSTCLLFAMSSAKPGWWSTPFLPGDSLLFALGRLGCHGTAVKLPIVIPLLCLAANCGDALHITSSAIASAPGSSADPAHGFSTAGTWRKPSTSTSGTAARRSSSPASCRSFARFAPFVAGIGRMAFPRFARFSISGGILWVVSLSLAGLLFRPNADRENNFQLVVLAIIFISSCRRSSTHCKPVGNQRGFEPLQPAPKETERV